MKNFKQIAFAFLMIFFAMSCEVNDTDSVDDPASETNALRVNLSNYANSAARSNQADNFFNGMNSNSNTTGGMNECFVFNYPIMLTDGQTETVINSDAEFEAYLENLTAPFNFVFPFSVTLSDGTTQTVNSEQDLEEIVFSCIDIGDPCFQFNYPLDLVDIDGNTVTVNSDYELLTAENIEDFIYPITVTTADGEVTINSSADFDNLYNDCYGTGSCDDCYDPCFEFIYPFTLLEDNGNIVTINSDEELLNYLSNLDANTTFEVTFPMNVRLSDGTEVQINNEQELSDLIDSCFD